MTPLRQKMIEDLRLRGMSTTTEEAYVGVVARYARWHGRSPAVLEFEDVRAFLLDLRERGRKRLRSTGGATDEPSGPRPSGHSPRS